MTAGLIEFIFFIIYRLLDLVVLCLIVYAVLSWLVAFNIINTRSPIVWRTMDFLDRIITPILAPFRAFVPNLGGLDISFILAWLVIEGLQRFLLPPAEASLLQLVGGTIVPGA
jgi:YggT family protein